MLCRNAFQIVIHGRELEGLYKYIDKDLLPEEYLPDDYEGPCAGSIKSILSECSVCV